MANSTINIRQSTYLGTLRTDKWWMYPAFVVFGFTAFVIYATWAAFQGNNYFYDGGLLSEGFGGYLSPMYSPLVFVKSGVDGGAPLHHAWFGEMPEWMPPFVTPAFFIVGFPLAFRFTCYYYRKAYYRAFAGSPPACAVGAVQQKEFKGETGLLIFQNLHRYALYFAILVLFVLAYDAFMSFFRNGQFGVGVGSIVLLINPILLGAYTFGCHSFRHLVGGQMDCMSCSSTRLSAWKRVTKLNMNHELWAWCSLVWVGFTDVYVRLTAMGVIHDFSTWGVN